jgi:hypothetical protein
VDHQLKVSVMPPFALQSARLRMDGILLHP